MPNDKERNPNAAGGHAQRDAAHAARDERQANKVFTYDAGDGSPARQVTIVSKDRGQRVVRDVTTGEELTVEADALTRPGDDAEGDDGMGGGGADTTSGA